MIKNKINHVAFILDGNKRWAKNAKLPKIQGYKKGFENIENIVDHTLSLNIPNLTLFTLSSENFNRPSINIIYEIIYKNFSKLINELVRKKNIKVNIFGSKKDVPQKILKIFEEVENTSKGNVLLNLNLAFNYGFKDEIKEVLKNYKKNYSSIDLNNYSEVRKLFYLGSIEDPDILIRTGGYKRLSNFIMFNLTYTELFFSDTLWPDFSINEYSKIIDKYLKIDRKYGL